MKDNLENMDNKIKYTYTGFAEEYLRLKQLKQEYQKRLTDIGIKLGINPKVNHFLLHHGSKLRHINLKGMYIDDNDEIHITNKDEYEQSILDYIESEKL